MTEGKKPYEIEISIKNKDHFDSLVSTLNRKIGKGKKYWSMPGKRNRVLTKLKNAPYNKSLMFGHVTASGTSSRNSKKKKKSPKWKYADPIKPIRVTLRVENCTPEIMSFLTYLTLRK